MEIIVCDRCGECPPDDIIFAGSRLLPDYPCCCGSIAWETIEVDRSELADYGIDASEVDEEDDEDDDGCPECGSMSKPRDVFDDGDLWCDECHQRIYL